MSDYRIHTLEDYNNVLDANSVIADDRSAFKCTKKLEISQIANFDYFNVANNNYLNDFIYYNNVSNNYYDTLFKINDTNTNINFLKRTIGKSVNYTPYTYNFKFDTYSQDDYGDYFKIDEYIEDSLITYIINPNFYNKNDLDTLFEGAKFDIKTYDEIIEIKKINDGNLNSSFYIENSALYTNSSNYSFNPFVSSYGEKSSGTFVLGNLYSNNHGGNSGNIFVINKNDKVAYYYDPNILSINGGKYISNTGGNHFSIVGSGIEDLSFGRSNFSIIGGEKDVNNRRRPNFSLQITQNPDYNNYDSYESYLVLGDWNNKTLYCNYEGTFEFNKSADWSFYVDGDYFYVGSLKHKIGDEYGYNRPIISFGEPINIPFVTQKFVISYINKDGEGVGTNRDLFYISEQNTGVFWKDKDLTERVTDKYEYMGYEDCILRTFIKNDIENGTLYYN